MKSQNKRKSGLLYQKVIKKAPRLYEPPKIREIPKRIHQPIEVPSFEILPLKPMPPVKEFDYEPRTFQRFVAPEKELIPSPRLEPPVFEPPVFEPLRGKEKREFKRENIQRVADKYGITRGQARKGLRKMRRAGEDYIPEEYLSSLNMVKRNSATQYKLPHQSKTALHMAGGWNSGVVGSSGKLTDDERAEATRLQDSIKGSYLNREFKLGRMIRGEDGAFITGPDGKRIREKIMLTPEQNLREYEMEGRGANFIDFTQDGKAVVRPVPSGDDDIPVQSFIKSLDSSQYRGYIPRDEDLPEDYQDPGLIEGHPLNPFEGYGRAENYRNR